MNSAPGFGRESSCGKPVGQNGVLTVLSESCDSHGRFPDSFPRALRL
ncbi:hypothetical protein CRG98_048599, partial [Punica granatum]